MSAIPQAVRRAAARAEELSKQFREGRAELPPAAPDSQPPPAPPVAVVTPPAAPPAAPSPPAPVSSTPPADTAEWERRYRSLQGKYNNEVPRLRSQVQQVTEELATVKQLLAQRVTQTNTPAPAAPVQPTRLVTDEEVREYGPDLIDMFRRVAREEHQTLTGEIDRRIQPVQQRIDRVAGAVESTSQRVAQSNRQTVLDALAQAVPNWEAMNDDPLFLEWLGQSDPFTGKERGALLTEAYEAFDAPRVVAFFTGYLREHAAVTPPATPQPTPEPPPAAPVTQVTLESLLAPGTPKAGAPRTPDGSEKRIWTRADVTNFYELKRRGKLKSLSPEQIQAMDADIIAAGREGRIR